MPTTYSTVTEILDAVSQGKIGHAQAIHDLHLETFSDLAETMRLNGLSFWAHKPVAPSSETMALLAYACGKTPPEEKPHSNSRKNRTAQPRSNDQLSVETAEKP